MTVSRAVYVALFLTLAACTLKQSGLVEKMNANDAIIGGKKALATDAVTASTVSIVAVFGEELYSFCSGTLISRNLVVTAAHCLGDGTDHLSVFFGETLPKKTSSAKLVKIANSAIHPDFKIIFDENDVLETTLNDVALIKLVDEDIPSSATPVPVLDITQEVSVADELVLAGYGLVNEIEQQERAEGLNYVKVPVAKILDYIIVTDQTNASGACNGDSGGPAYMETPQGLVVVGATRGPHEGALDCRHYGEYTNLSKFKNFILEYGEQIKAQLPLFVTVDKKTVKKF